MTGPITWSDLNGPFLPFKEFFYPVMSGRTAGSPSRRWTWQMGLTLVNVPLLVIAAKAIGLDPLV